MIAIALGIALGLMRRGRVQGLALLGFRQIWLLAIGAAIWLAISPLPVQLWLGVASFGGVLQLTAHVFLLGFVWQNRRVPWLPLIGAGLLANFVVMAANGGQMPVDAALLGELGIEDKIMRAQAQGMWVHFNPLGDAARLEPLGDWIILRRPFPWPGILSPGDVLVALGALLVTQAAMVGKRDMLQ